MSETNERSEGRSEFEHQALRKPSGGPLGEFWYLLGRSRKYWMAPIILALLVIGFLIVTGGTAVAPLLYTLF
jgi:hypothetical protein